MSRPRSLAMGLSGHLVLGLLVTGRWVEARLGILLVMASGACAWRDGLLLVVGRERASYGPRLRAMVSSLLSGVLVLGVGVPRGSCWVGGDSGHGRQRWVGRALWAIGGSWVSGHLGWGAVVRGLWDGGELMPRWTSRWSPRLGVGRELGISGGSGMLGFRSPGVHGQHGVGIVSFWSCGVGCVGGPIEARSGMMAR